jgi:uncharacterized protein
MDPVAILLKYYKAESRAWHILRTHSEAVARKALEIADRHPELQVDRAFVREAAMLHDIGVFLCDAPEIDCHGPSPYICHGVLGADLLRREGYPRHALVCERHTGTGLSLAEIKSRLLLLPHRDMLPLSEEEQLVCFADKFFSKTRLERERTIDAVKLSLAKHGEGTLQRLNQMIEKYA